MHILEIDYPGKTLDNSYENVGQLTDIISHMQFAFNEAVVSLNYFEMEFSSSKSLYEVEIYMEIFEAKVEEIMQKKGENTNRNDLEIEARRKLWEDGTIPKDYFQILVYIYAKNFLVNLISIYKLVSIMAEEFGQIVPDIKSIKEKIETKYKGIKGSHDNKNRKSLIPVDNDLSGTNYRCTFMDGNYYEVEVSIGTLNFFKDVFQNIINSLKWVGVAEICPK